MPHISALFPILALSLTCAFANAQTAPNNPKTIPARILQGARAEAAKKIPYIMQYKTLKYPGGDVPAGTGVCTDLVVRAMRNAGIDLQKEVHEDRVAHPDEYPIDIWEIRKPDKNIDHRRCPNLVAWLRRHAKSLPTETNAEALKKYWQKGDIVFYVRPGASHPWHVGIVSDRKTENGMPFIIDSFPPHTSETHQLNEFAPIHSHFRITNR